MGVMIVTTIVVAILTLIGTAVWWMMMNSWVEKDRRGRGRHFNDPGGRSGAAHPDAGHRRADGGGESEIGDGPIVMR